MQRREPECEGANVDYFISMPRIQLDAISKDATICHTRKELPISIDAFYIRRYTMENETNKWHNKNDQSIMKSRCKIITYNRETDDTRRMYDIPPVMKLTTSRR
jgi:hypothetical protein